MVAMAASMTAVLTNSFGGRLVPARTRAPQTAAEAAEARMEVAPEVAREEVAALEATTLEAPAHVILEVPDIHCAGCENNIETLLGGRAGIDQVDADAKAHRVQVFFQPERIGLAEIEEAVTSLGYRVQRAHVPGAEAS